MSDEMRPGARPDAAAWLVSGPDRAPAGLLARSLEQTHATRQRSAVVAVALGAPTLARRPQALSPVRVWLLVALLAVAAAAVAIAAGWPDRTQLVVLPSRPPSTPESPAPSSSDGPDAYFTRDLGHGVIVSHSLMNPWTSVRDYPGGNAKLFAGRAFEFAFDDCPGGCGPHVIDVTLGTFAQGLIYGWEPCTPDPSAGPFGCSLAIAVGNGEKPLTVQGTTTDELVAAWIATFGDADVSHISVGQATWSIVDDGTRAVALIAGTDTVIAVALHVTPGIPWIGLHDRLTQFLTAVQFAAGVLPSAPPVTRGLGDISIAVPGSWTPSITSTTLQLQSSGFLPITLTVSKLQPGAQLIIQRQSQDPPTRFTVSGATLEELAASIDAGLGDAERHDRSIGGQAGYVWAVPQHAIVGPLAYVAIVEWKGSFYVFRQQLPLDGLPGDTFAVLLDSVQLS